MLALLSPSSNSGLAYEEINFPVSYLATARDCEHLLNQAENRKNMSS